MKRKIAERKAETIADEARNTASRTMELVTRLHCDRNMTAFWRITVAKDFEDFDYFVSTIIRDDKC